MLVPQSVLPTRPGSIRTILASLLFVGIVPTAGCTTQSESPSTTEDQPLPVIEAEALEIKPRPWPTIVRSQGNLVADEVAVVGAKVAGRVVETPVDLGDLVRADQPLVSLDREEFRLKVDQVAAQLAQSRSSLGLDSDALLESLEPKNSPPVRQEKALWEEAQANHERAERLQDNGAITQTEYDQIVAAERVAEARYDSAINAVEEKIALVGVRRAELALARQQLHDATIRAPFEGLVQQRHVASGTYVNVGEAIVTLVRTNPLRFRGAMPERHAQQLALGQEIRLQIESITEPRIARITRISPALNPLSRSLLFEAEVENNNRTLRSGLFAEAEVILDPHAKALVAPHSAIVEFAGAEKVWKVVDNVAQEQEVLTGARRPEGIEILEGLVAGDRILRHGLQGRPARITPIDSPSEESSFEPPNVFTQGEGPRTEELLPGPASSE